MRPLCAAPCRSSVLLSQSSLRVVRRCSRAGLKGRRRRGVKAACGLQPHFRYLQAFELSGGCSVKSLHNAAVVLLQHAPSGGCASEVAALYKRSLSLTPAVGVYRYNRAAALQQLGRNAEAQLTLARALQQGLAAASIERAHS